MRTDAPRRDLRRTAIGAALALLAVLAVAGATAAGDRGRMAPPPNAAWKTECGACHLAYPPRLLPARSWRAIMSGLDRHFGTDASLDPAQAAEIASFLERHAGRERGGAAPLRITETPWFRREHREVPVAVWARPSVGSPANCAACHRAAEQGDYDDDTVTIPR